MRFLLTLSAAVLIFAGAALAQPQGVSAPKMDMKAFMARCVQLRQQPGTAQSPLGREVLDQCDQMDRSMGMAPPARR